MNQRTVDPLLLLGSVILFAATLTWVIPSGQYKRSSDSLSGSTTVVPGSYRTVAAHPVGVGGLLLSIPRGVEDGAQIVFYVLFSGAALTVVELTGAVGAVLGSMAKQFAKRPLLVLSLIAPFFLFGGAAYSMSEEIIAFIPLICVLMRRLHLPNTMAVAISFGSATVAGAFLRSTRSCWASANRCSGCACFRDSCFAAWSSPSLSEHGWDTCFGKPPE